ncbi:MAG TPA: sigma-54 dependent transcriptional regulator [Candidatus Xenobia bacterium]|nr:sigma-54 dependent transcriptional regulator [Candidatus Xenobia bacterium]
MATLLIIDDEPIGESLALAFRREQYDVSLARNTREARARLEQQLYDIIVCDITLPDGNGIELLEFGRQVSPDSVFLLMTGKEHPQELIIQALNLGADRYIVKSDRTIEEVESVVHRAEEFLRTRRERDLFQRAARELARDNIVGQSRALRAALDTARAIAPTNSTVLITGESGTGKELVARRIHELSPRFDHPFVSLNCGAFPETLLESELFGYLKGAFTGATHSKPGLFQAANGGTLFLDEIGEMSLPMQVKLLRVLQERKVRPLGATEELSVDVRVIAATNKDLKQLVSEKAFREDLYYRITVIPLHMPPLRERPEDIPLLALHFLKRFSEQMGKPLRGLSAEALEALRAYSWPGNVRELENVIERAVALETGEEISLRSLAEQISRIPARAPGQVLIPEEGIDFQKHIEEQERAYLQAALEQAGGVRTKAAELLGMSYRSFRHYAKKHNL